MTNEEAQIIIGNIPIKPEVLDDCYSIAEYQEAKAMAIKALEQTAEQQSCEDAISRAALLEELGEEPFNWNDSPEAIQEVRDYQWFRTLVENAPSVTTKPKIGHWITTRTFMHDGEFYCDKCKCDAPNNEKWDYCPNCGVKMEVEE